MTYRSRHQPRSQQTIGGKIRNPERYDMFYDIAFDAMLRGDFPSMTVDTGLAGDSSIRRRRRGKSGGRTASRPAL